MEIFINNEPMVSSLENEKNIGQVFDQINSWIESNGKFLIDCFVDGNEFNYSSMREQSIQETQRIDFVIGEEIDVLISSLRELDSYVDKIGNTLFRRDSLTENEVKLLREGIDWVLLILGSAEKLLKINYQNIKPMGRGVTVSEILDYITTNFDQLESFDKIENFLEKLRDLKVFISDLISRTQVLELNEESLLNILEKFTSSIPELKEQFIKVNEHYQSGNDALATRILTESINLVNVLVTTLISINNKFPKLQINEMEIESVKFEEKNQEIHTVLLKVAEALEKNDIISAGDLIEYELPMLIDELGPFLKLIQENITKYLTLG